MTKDERHKLLYQDDDSIEDAMIEFHHWDMKACFLLDDLIEKVETLVERVCDGFNLLHDQQETHHLRAFPPED